MEIFVALRYLIPRAFYWSEAGAIIVLFHGGAEVIPFIFSFPSHNAQGVCSRDNCSATYFRREFRAAYIERIAIGRDELQSSVFGKIPARTIHAAQQKVGFRVKLCGQTVRFNQLIFGSDIQSSSDTSVWISFIAHAPFLVSARHGEYLKCTMLRENPFPKHMQRGHSLFYWDAIEGSVLHWLERLRRSHTGQQHGEQYRNTN